MSPRELNVAIFNYIDKKIEELKKLHQTKEPTKYLTRKEVAELL